MDRSAWEGIGRIRISYYRYMKWIVSSGRGAVRGQLASDRGFHMLINRKYRILIFVAPRKMWFRFDADVEPLIRNYVLIEIVQLAIQFVPAQVACH